MSILITGGAGYIGSHVANLLFEKNYKVIVVDNLSTGFKSSLHPDIIFKQGDVLDHDFLNQLFNENEIESVFHFASLLNIKESLFKPLDYYRVNVGGLMNVLKFCESYSVRKLIFSSSSTVYGNNSNSQMNETSLVEPINPYGHTKLFSEQMIRDFAFSKDFHYKILRYFNVAGAAANNSNGQRTRDAYHLVHLASKAALGLRSNMLVYGDNYSTPDGSCVRDYIHVQDLAELHILAYENIIETQSSPIINCGYGIGFSVKQVLKSMNELAPRPFKIQSAERRPGDPDHLVASTDLLRKTFPKWKPKHDQLELICQSALTWEAKLLQENRG